MEKRIECLDFARFFAIFAMIIVNFSIVMGASGKGPKVLNSILNALEGRAAATFVILAGIGMSLMAKKALQSNVPSEQMAVRKRLLFRAIFLFIVGYPVVSTFQLLPVSIPVILKHKKFFHLSENLLKIVISFSASRTPKSPRPKIFSIRRISSTICFI